MDDTRSQSDPVMPHIWMSRVTHMNQSCHTYESVMSRTYDWVVSNIWMSYVTYMNEPCHTYEWVMSHTWMSRVKHDMEIIENTSNLIIFNIQKGSKTQFEKQKFKKYGYGYDHRWSYMWYHSHFHIFCTKWPWSVSGQLTWDYTFKTKREKKRIWLSPVRINKHELRHQKRMERGKGLAYRLRERGLSLFLSLACAWALSLSLALSLFLFPPLSISFSWYHVLSFEGELAHPKSHFKNKNGERARRN